MLEHLSTSTPKDLPDSVHSYGLTPAVELRHGQDREGVLVEVDAESRETNRWRVRHNAHAVGFLEGRRVVIPPGYPRLLQDLREGGAEPTEARREAPPEVMARDGMGGVILI